MNHDDAIMLGHDDAYRRYRPDRFTCGCHKTCDELQLWSDMIECEVCQKYIWKEHYETHLTECQEK